VRSVFVLDDDQEQAELLASALRASTTIVVRTFTDPIRALAALNEEGTDLLVADIAMPWMDGVDVVSSARVKRPDLKVILVSGAEHGAEIARRNGLPFLAKPIDVDALLAKVRDVLL